MRKFQLAFTLAVAVSFVSMNAGWQDYLPALPSGSLFSRGAGFWSSPADEKVTSFFGRLTESQSQRENWYAVTPYVAEFWCALSNAGFVYVGIKDRSPEVLFAGLASIASHTAPKQWLLYIDKLGVLVALSKVLREFKELKKNPKLIFPVLALGAVNATDAYLARYKGQTWGHVVWHLSAAYIAYYLLQSIKRPDEGK